MEMLVESVNMVVGKMERGRGVLMLTLTTSMDASETAKGSLAGCEAFHDR